MTSPASIVDRTQDQYNSNINQFVKWGGVRPCTSSKVLRYIIERGALDRVDRLKVSTLKAHLASIKAWHEDDEWPDPTRDRRIKKELNRLESLERQNGIEKSAARALTPEETLKVVTLLMVMDDTPKALRDRLIFTIGLVSGHRRGMVAEIKIDHLRNLNIPNTQLIIDTPAFKTKVEAPTYIPYSGTQFCPATWLRQYVNDMADLNGYLFKGTQQDFGKPLSGNTINNVAKEILKTAGIQGGKLTSGTFRKTMATLAVMRNVNSIAIAAQGGWGDVNTMNKSYVSKAVALLGEAPKGVLDAIQQVDKSLTINHQHDAAGFNVTNNGVNVTKNGVSIELSSNEINELYALRNPLF